MREKDEAEIEEEKARKCCKNVLTSLYVRGSDPFRDELRDLCEEAGFGFSERTWRRWELSYAESGAALKRYFETGRPIKFDEEKRKLIMGYIVHNILTNIVINNEDVQKWAQDVLKVDSTVRTIRTLTREMGFSVKKSKTKTKGFTLDRDESAKLYTEFIKRKAHPVFREKALCSIASIDFTYTSHMRDAQPCLSITGE